MTIDKILMVLYADCINMKFNIIKEYYERNIKRC